MSVVIYSEGVLGADKRAVINGAQWNVFSQPTTKVHTHESKSFAIAFAGHLPGPRSLKIILNTIYQMLIKFTLEETQESMEITEELASRLFAESRTSIIVMTKTDTWLFAKKHKHWIELTAQNYYSGNGAPCAAMCIGAGLTVIQALTEIPKVCIECGDGYDVVRAVNLKHIQVEK